MKYVTLPGGHTTPNTSRTAREPRAREELEGVVESVVAFYEDVIGGVGASGMGAYHGKFGFDTFSHLKSVMKRSFWFDVAIRYAPSSARKRFLLKKLL